MIVDRSVLPLALSMLFVALAADAHARSAFSSAHEVRLGQCIRHAAAGRTWLERTLWGLRDQEAGWVGAEILNSNGTHDLGPLQINSSWIPKLAKLTSRSRYDVRFGLINDPCFNVQAARWIFLMGLSTTRDYWKAIGMYHSPTAWRQRQYSAFVAAKLRKRYGEAVFN